MIKPAHHQVCCETPERFGAIYEDVTLRTADGVQLSGWYIPSQNGAAVILLHGYGGDRTGSLTHAEMLHRHGFGVLLYDQRANSESQGETLSWGWRDVADVESALNFLGTRPDVAVPQYGILGCSTGAEITVGAGAQFGQIGAIVADGLLYTSIRDTWLPHDFKDWLGWPAQLPVIHHLHGMAQRRIRAPFVDRGCCQTRAASAPADCRRKRRDAYEQWRSAGYYRAAAQPKEYWVVEGATHCGGPAAQPAAVSKQE